MPNQFQALAGDSDDWEDLEDVIEANKTTNEEAKSGSGGATVEAAADSEILHKIKKSKFVGLLNQGATCYLNSLLQLLYMTPELRQGLFSLTRAELDELQGGEGDDAEERKLKIPHALIELFVNLQTTCTTKTLLKAAGDAKSLRRALENHKSAVSTKRVTDSFGWENQEARVQQDVNELFRLIVRVLDKKLKHSTSAKLMEIFHGKTRSQTKCRTCGYSNPRDEGFIDVIVPVSGHKSLQDSLQAYFSSEEMTGDSQYMCAVCPEKQDADRSLKLAQVPDTFAFSLNRFEYNWNKNRREKVNTRFEFTQELDMAPYVDTEALSLGADGTLMYDLVCCIIHRGSASSGHYFCYIRDLMNEVAWDPSKRVAKTAPKKKNNNNSNGNSNKRRYQTRSQTAKAQIAYEALNGQAKEAYDLFESLLLAAPKTGILMTEVGDAFKLIAGAAWSKTFKKKLGSMPLFIGRLQHSLQIDSDEYLCLTAEARTRMKEAATKLFGDSGDEADQEGEEDGGEEHLEVKGETPSDSKEAKTPADPTTTTTTTAPPVGEEEGREEEAVAQQPEPAHWFEFNDAMVSPVPVDILEKFYGGGNSESAYMLFYRKRETADTKQVDKKTLCASALPVWMDETWKRTVAEAAIKRSTVTVNLSFLQPQTAEETSGEQKTETELPLHEQVSLTKFNTSFTVNMRDSVASLVDKVNAQLQHLHQQKVSYVYHLVTEEGVVPVPMDAKNLVKAGFAEAEVELLVEVTPAEGEVILAEQEYVRREMYCTEVVLRLSTANDQPSIKNVVYIPLKATLGDLKTYASTLYQSQSGIELTQAECLEGRFFAKMFVEDLDFEDSDLPRYQQLVPETKLDMTILKWRGKARKQKATELSIYWEPRRQLLASELLLQFIVTDNLYPEEANTPTIYSVVAKDTDPLFQVRLAMCQEVCGRRGDGEDAMAFDHLLQTSLIARLQNAKKEADLLFRDESQTVSELKLLEQQVLCLEVANLRPPTLLSFQVLLRHPDSDSKHGGYFASGQAAHAASCSQDAVAVAESKGEEGACGGCGFPLDLFRFQREELQPIADTVDLDDSAMLQTLRVSAAKAVMAQQQLELPPSGHVLRLSFLDDELQPFCVLRNKALRLKELMRKRRKHHPQMKLDASRPLSEAYNRPVCLFAEWVSRDLETQNTPSCLLVHVTERHSLALDIQEPAAAELESKNSAETKQKHTKAAVVAVTGANKPPITAMLNKDMHDSLDKVKGFLLANYFPQMEEVENMELAIYDKHRFTWQILYQHAPKGKNRSRKKKGRKRRNRVQRKKTWGVLKQLKDHEAFAVYDKRALGDLGEFGQRDPKTKKAAPCRYFTPFDVLMADTDLHPHYNLSCSIALTVTVSSDPSKKKKAVSEPVLYIDGGEWDSSDEDDSSD